MIKLSKRLSALCDMVPEGSTLCDVGCDHAHVEIRLLQEDRVKSAIAMDVADGPLQRARENLELTGLSDKCEVRKSDGLSAYKKGEAQTLLIAGMGGILMRSILEEDPEKTEDFRYLILEPQSEQWLVREFIEDSACFAIRDEKLIVEDGKYYPVIFAEKRSADENDAPLIRPQWESCRRQLSEMDEETVREARIDRETVLCLLEDPLFRRKAELTLGPVLIGRKDEALYEYVTFRLRTSLSICEKLAAGAGTAKEPPARTQERLRELSGEIGLLQVILFIFTWCR